MQNQQVVMFVRINEAIKAMAELEAAKERRSLASKVEMILKDHFESKQNG